MDKAFVLGMIEMVIMGVSTRKVTKIVEQLCGENVSKSFVSDLMQELDPQIEVFKQRSFQLSVWIVKLDGETEWLEFIQT